MLKKIISLLLCLTMCVGFIGIFTACDDGDDNQGGGGTGNNGGNGGNSDKALVIMSDVLDGLFNPFYATSGNDTTIVGMTQLGMLTTGSDANGNVTVAYGDKEAVVVKDYEKVYDSEADETTYTFVIKNGITYSDGHPLTIEDVIFNMYVYLDPVYTGSSTMYSTKIKGLADYRNQTPNSDENYGDVINENASGRAKDRIQALIDVFTETADLEGSDRYETTKESMLAAINGWVPTSAYKKAVAVPSDYAKVTSANLKADYELALKYFREELETDFDTAKEAYTENPYKSFDGNNDGKGDFDEITSFMYYEGFVTVEFGDKNGKPNADKSVIKSVERGYNEELITTREAAIEHVYNAKINTELHTILTYWATAQKLTTEFTAKAKEIVLREQMTGDELTVPNIEGIKSLGHNTDMTTVTVDGTEYKVAREHNADGTPKNAGEYDVLRITIEGIDPKAVWNFAFAVAPQHYYAAGNEVDLVNNKFGVKFSSFDFMTYEIQSQRNVTLPMGAGAYKVTDAQNSDNPTGSGFFQNNVVYFKANSKFLLGAPKIEKVRYQVVSSSNALQALEAGSVHFVTPQLTPNNEAKLESLKSSGFASLQAKQLGYGYVGVNAAKIPNIYLRKAIMAAMDTGRAITYYSAGTAERIFWPMSMVSWAYPMTEDMNGNKIPNMINGQNYPLLQFTESTAKQNIMDYMALAADNDGGYSDSDLKVTFTIAGSNLTDHPTYQVFQMAAQLLNDCGWDVTVIADSQALTKISTGSLTVWAAAWGTTVDPDMYQVYHMNSTASSTKAWGYDAIKADTDSYEYEQLQILSGLIDDARETEDQDERTLIYEDAMRIVLDLAIELPVYQRNELYAYNTNVIKASSLPDDVNPYTSPLDKLWEIEFAD